MRSSKSLISIASKGTYRSNMEYGFCKPSVQALRFSSSSGGNSILGSSGKNDSSFHSNVDSAIGASTHEENMQRYKTDRQTAARWLDIGVVKRKGRVYDATSKLIPAAQAMTFPNVQCTSIDGVNRSIPLDLPAEHKVKLVVFSFKHYGFTLVRSWLDPFIQKYPSSEVAKNQVAAVEICFIEYGFLAMAKNIFINSIKNNIADSQSQNTYLTFGGVTVSMLSLLCLCANEVIAGVRESVVSAQCLHRLCLSTR